MKVKVIGKKKGQFTNDKGQEQKTFKVFCTHKTPYDSEWAIYEGEACSEISLPEEIFNEIKIGGNYLMDFDKNGKLYDVEEL